MDITLEPDQLALLISVEQGRVHADPRFTLPNFEKDPDPPFMTHRATRRLRSLKNWLLVELVGEAHPVTGVRLYPLTEEGQRVLAEARAQEATAHAESATWGTPTDSPAASAAGATPNTRETR